HGQARGDGRRAAVDPVQSIGVHVVREARRSPDAGHEHRVLAAHAELGHEQLHGGEDRVVATARAPAHLLVAGPLLARGDGYGRVGHARASMIARSSSPSVNGTPFTLLAERTSTRYSARSSLASCPRFISGHSTFGL